MSSCQNSWFFIIVHWTFDFGFSMTIITMVTVQLQWTSYCSIGGGMWLFCFWFLETEYSIQCVEYYFKTAWFCYDEEDWRGAAEARIEVGHDFERTSKINDDCYLMITFILCGTYSIIFLCTGYNLIIYHVNLTPKTLKDLRSRKFTSGNKSEM